MIDAGLVAPGLPEKAALFFSWRCSVTWMDLRQTLFWIRRCFGRLGDEYGGDGPSAGSGQARRPTEEYPSGFAREPQW
jgi:hypothetical protein